MAFNVHLEQFNVASTRTRAAISLICDYLINSKICDVTLVLRNVITCDKDGGGVKKSRNLCDVIYGWPQMWRLQINHLNNLFYLLHPSPLESSK